MSTAIAKNLQVGSDPTATNNFTIFQPATPDGTLRIGNGNTGITSSLLTLTSAGNLTVSGSTVIQGLTVGRGAGAVSSNTAVGASALAANTSGAYSVVLGYEAGNANQTGAELTLVGFQAGKATTGSGGLTAVGVQAGLKNTTGILNTFIGGYAGKETTSGSNSVAVGYQALQANTTASNNTAVGYQAGYSNTTGADNTFLGQLAGYGVTTGNRNTLVGFYTGSQMTTGTFNNFIGTQAGQGVTSGSKNTIIGSYSGNQGGLDIRTASNHIVLSDGDGNPRVITNSVGATFIGQIGNAFNNFPNRAFGVAGASGGYPAIAMGAPGGGYGYIGYGAAPTASAYVYYANDTASIITFASGGIQTYTAPIGTAGNAISFTNGPYVSFGGTSWTSSSDARLKNITGEIENALDKVNSLRAARFTWKNDPSAKPQIGLIAQDLEAVLPEVVVYPPENARDGVSIDPYLGVNYTEVIPLLVAAIKELKAEFDAYKATHP
jgi:hypothetical protein